jgi:4-amino-4-deoxy-L-arabinose transferase-like glycosyltransferase
MHKASLIDQPSSAARVSGQDSASGAPTVGISTGSADRAVWLLLTIVALAFGLRIWGIDFGLPYELTYDEGKEIHRALKLGAGEYYWGFGKGGLYYILFVEYALLYIYWWLTGGVANTHDFAIQIVRDPSILFLLGRLTVAVLGTLSCLVIFQVGRHTYDWRLGLAAALLAATSYVHAVFSHVINVDIGMMLAMWAAILAYLLYEKTAQTRWLIGAGIFAGLTIAFKLPGAVVLPALFLAIGSRSEHWRQSRRMLKQAGLVLLAAVVALTIVAPEWIFGLGSVLQPYLWLVQGQVAASGVFDGDLHDRFRAVTTRGGGPRTIYLETLIEPRNLLLTLAAAAGAGIGFLRRERWTMIWSVLTVLFVGVMSLSSRGQSEHYLLPILPCLWLLGARALMAISGRPALVGAGLVGIVALPTAALVRQNHELTQPDTRVIAKEWIESNIPSGARILADSFQYRFTPSPPLIPDHSAVLRQIEGVSGESNRFRGVSQNTLKLYAEAMQSVSGPRYELHPTVWGLTVQDPGYYAERCFDYIITSSIISDRYRDDLNRQRFPKSARFYEHLDDDPRLQKVYVVEPIDWQRPGPTITVYKLLLSCKKSETLASDTGVH